MQLVGRGGEVSWELKKETKISSQKNGGVRKKVKFTQSGESTSGEQGEVDKGVQLEKGYEENDTLKCA